MTAALAYDIPDWRRLSEFAATKKVNNLLGQRGFCFIDGFAEDLATYKARLEARRLRQNGAMRLTPREACEVLLGARTSYWTLPLEDDSSYVPDAEAENLRKIDDCLNEVGIAIAKGSHLSFGELVSRQPGLLHHAKMPEDRERSPRSSREEADYWANEATQKKVILLYYLGPSTATVAVRLRADPTSMYKVASSKENFIVAYRNDACVVTVGTKPGISSTLQVDFLMRSKQGLQRAPCDRLPLPSVLTRWYAEELHAVADGSLSAQDAPLHLVRDAVTSIFKTTPVRIVQLWHDLPALPRVCSRAVSFEASLLGGLDVVTEICKPGGTHSWCGKWDPDEYYDPDPAMVDDFKMYTRHLSVLNRGHDPAKDYDLRDFGILQAESLTMDHRAPMLAEAHASCLKLANLGAQDTRGANMGFFVGLCGSELALGFLSGQLKVDRFAAFNMSNAAIANRLAYALNCTGPSVSLDTGDASGSAALDMAVQSLRDDRSGPFSFASACHWISHPHEVVLQCAMGAIARSGRTRVFDDTADGFVRGEGVVAALLQLHVEPATEEEQKTTEKGDEKKKGSRRPGGKDRPPDGARPLILGSGLNTNGISSSLTAPSGPGLKDAMARAARDANVPTSILDAIEVSAGGSVFHDAVEWGTTALITRAADRDGDFSLSCMVRAGKATYGNLKPVNGLVSVARACKLIELGAHGPMLHLRQVMNMSVFEDDSDQLGGRLQLLTEVVEARFLSQLVGVSSFGCTGTNCHHVLFGSKPDAKTQPTKAAPVTFWPGGPQEDAHPPREGYYIVGTWSSWKTPCLMQPEAEGVYGYTLTMGENGWEKFQIWVDEDPDRVLHPLEPNAAGEAQVAGPDRFVRRDLSWRVLGRSDRVRLLNEDQLRALRGEHDEREYRCVVAYPGNWLPAGAKSVVDMPLVDLNQSCLGGPGDKYRIRLHAHGDYKRVEWSKVEAAEYVADGKEGLPEPEEEHGYQLIGDHSFWENQDMMKDPNEAGVYRATVQLLKERSNFQIIRDHDLEQCFYPKVAGAGPEAEILGPDPEGHGRNWQIRGSVGDYFCVEFRRGTPRRRGGQEELAVRWNFNRSGKVDFAKLTRSHRYYFAGASSDFGRLEEMTRDQTSGNFSHEIVIGPSNSETFQLVLNENWLATVHPNVNNANIHDEAGHELEGPDDAGDDRYWTIGSHAMDRVTEGTHMLVHLEVDDRGLPKRVWWEKYDSPSSHLTAIAMGRQRMIERHYRLHGFTPYESADRPARLVQWQPFMDRCQANHGLLGAGPNR